VQSGPSLPQVLGPRLALPTTRNRATIRSDIMSGKTLNPFLAPADALTIQEWYVKVDGADPVGPVSADQIARGIRAGRIPEDAEVVRRGESDWEGVFDSHAVLEALKAL
jgi:hypothetical protein